MPIVILDIIKLSLEIVLQVLKDMPPEQRQQIWAQHQKNLEFWERLGQKLIPE